MKKHIVVALAAALALTWGVVLSDDKPSTQSEPQKDILAGTIEGLEAINLLQAKLESVEGTEVFVSRVTVPPNTTLPKHWHPGEEFGYVISGAVTFWQEGQPDTVLAAGQAAVIPLKVVHTVTSGAEGATLLVFRVHQEGQPMRVLVDD